MATTRRRGEELEQAIFEAVWAELAEHGYAKITMDGIAARAHTSKPVLYRRWPSLPELVIASLSRNAPTQDDLPDTGDLRTDLVTFLRQLARRFDDLPGDAIHGLMVDALRDPELRESFNSQVIQALRVDMLGTMLRRAADRGEIIGGDRLTPRVITLPLTLLREEFLTHGVLPDDVVDEIVDDIILPLLRAQRST